MLQILSNRHAVFCFFNVFVIGRILRPSFSWSAGGDLSERHPGKLVSATEGWLHLEKCESEGC